MASAVFGLRCHSPRAVAAAAFGLWLSRSSGRGCRDLRVAAVAVFGLRRHSPRAVAATGSGLWLPRSSGRDYLTTAVFGLRRHSLGLWLPQPPGCGCHDLRVVAVAVFGLQCHSPRAVAATTFWLWPLRDEAPTVLGLWRGIFRWAPV